MHPRGMAYSGHASPSCVRVMEADDPGVHATVDPGVHPTRDPGVDRAAARAGGGGTHRDTASAMPTRVVPCVAGVVYHVTNRARAGLTLFDSALAYAAFVDLMEDTRLLRPIRILAYSVMPNHWHLLLWPETDHAVRAFVGLLAMTHAKRFQRWTDTVGSGAIYPRRYWASAVQCAPSRYWAARYVERNPVRAGFVSRAEAWPASSAAPTSPVQLSPWPVPRPANWLDYVNDDPGGAELEAVRTQFYGQRLRPSRRRAPVRPAD
jgi:putative transposase